MRNYKTYDKTELFSKIDQISIEKVGSQIITKYGDRVISTSNVSNRYEIFDIRKYLKDKIDSIEKNFNIVGYRLELKGGRQYLQLISDKVSINDIDFYKSFYILNSSDKTRRLSFNIGLYSEKNNLYIIPSVKNIGLTKKHLKGVTKAAEDASVGINGETFDEQIEAIKSIIGHRVAFSKIREVIIGENDDIPQINHRKFDAFKNTIRWANDDSKIRLTSDQKKYLSIPSEKIKEVEQVNDFYIDAFYAFQAYLTIFNRQDSHIIKNETERIMKITQWAVRNNALEALGI
jgi:hypothetical protein